MAAVKIYLIESLIKICHSRESNSNAYNHSTNEGVSIHRLQFSSAFLKRLLFNLILIVFLLKTIYAVNKTTPVRTKA